MRARCEWGDKNEPEKNKDLANLIVLMRSKKAHGIVVGTMPVAELL
jgi:hypothetical protein